MASPCFAEPDWPATVEHLEVLELLGGHGCTLSDDSLADALAVGLAFEAIQLVALSAQATGQAKAQGSFIVFDESVCTIRLPRIESSLTISDFGSRVL
ncbi:hypothetical protein Q4555_01600 [Octadecabacter sp. 1_MG-2023]|uniref:hypothetical protein n=1 Tax=unclassified Octadecabacter TaxID=196158 RepID=UPI001C0989B7|nr:MULTISPECIES: hypothetical protein [unclassified Octadecabacter]MBU2993203.1 hypothetical protein [Octadecabacter sp. B2R22]MDO6733344.1 hypothetical protein [Octadecabacter sp. 1_MG-2023]